MPRPGRPPTKEHASVGTRLRDLGDPGNAGNITALQSGFIKLVSTGAETRTVDDPTFLGQELILFFETDGGDVTVTFDSAVNQTGNNTATFADAGDFQYLIGGRDGAGDFEWREVANDGAALSTV